MTNETSRITKLRDIIKEHFNVGELRLLCDDIGVKYEDLSGETLILKVQELVSYCYRHNRTQELITVCKRSRPHAMWIKLDDRYDEGGYMPHNQPLVQTPRIGKIPKELNGEELEKFLLEYRDWAIIETQDLSLPQGIRRELYRVYEFPTYLLAFSFMKEVSIIAVERYDHHPRWQNAYNRVEVWLTTFNLGYKPSNKDLRLAKLFERIWQEFKTELF